MDKPTAKVQPKHLPLSPSSPGGAAAPPRPVLGPLPPSSLPSRPLSPLHPGEQACLRAAPALPPSPQERPGPSPPHPQARQAPFPWGPSCPVYTRSPPLPAPASLAPLSVTDLARAWVVAIIVTRRESESEERLERNLVLCKDRLQAGLGLPAAGPLPRGASPQGPGGVGRGPTEGAWGLPLGPATGLREEGS